jgi:hypothetical protein
MESDVKSYEDLVKFVSTLPASAPPGSIISRYNHLEDIIDPRVERELASKEAIYIFDKYFINQVDRRKLIAAVLNVKIIG